MNRMIGFAQRSPLTVTHCSMPPMATKPFSSTGASADAQPGAAIAAVGGFGGVVDAQAASANASRLAMKAPEVFDMT